MEIVSYEQNEGTQEMMEVLRIVSGSWPIALMFVAGCIGVVLLYLIRRSFKYKEDMNLTRVQTSRDVTHYNYDDAGAGR